MAAGCITQLSLLITIFFHLVLHSSNQLLSSGFYFEKIHGNDDSDAGNTLKAFHQCSVDQTCVYVVKTSKEADSEEVTGTITNLQNYYAVWKKVEQPGYSDCKEARDLGVKNSGVVKLRLSASLVVQGFCNMITDGGGWTVFQRRIDDSVSFNRTWKSYKEGFGKPSGNYWLGLEAIHQLTSTGKTVLRIELKRDDNAIGYAEYTNFKILSEAQEYKLNFDRYSGNIGDALDYNINCAFSTYDNDNDKATWNCASVWRGGWWHNDCFRAHLNNDYYNNGETDEKMARTMSWRSFWTDDSFGKIIYSEMKLRKSN